MNSEGGAIQSVTAQKHINNVNGIWSCLSITTSLDLIYHFAYRNALQLTSLSNWEIKCGEADGCQNIPFITGKVVMKIHGLCSWASRLSEMTLQGHTFYPVLQVTWCGGAPEKRGWLCPLSFSSNHLLDKNGEPVGELRANGAASMWKKIAMANMPPPHPTTLSQVSCTYPLWLVPGYEFTCPHNDLTR